MSFYTILLSLTSSSYTKELEESLKNLEQEMKTLTSSMRQIKARLAQAERKSLNYQRSYNNVKRILSLPLSSEEMSVATLTQRLALAHAEIERIRVNFIGMEARARRASQEAERYHMRVKVLENTLRQGGGAKGLRHSLTYRLGDALVRATQSWRGAFEFPFIAYAIYTEDRRRKRGKRMSGHSARNFYASPVMAPPSPLLQEKMACLAATLQAPARRLKIAAIMDEFTSHCYAPECDLLELTPEHWHEEISAFQPDILFLESAWKGKEDLWKGMLSGNDARMEALIAWCNAQKVPTLLWNKEDPVHFSTFLPIAKQVDMVFTTDIDCIPRYKYHVGHARVYLLPFAAQPHTHNPLEQFARKDAFNFAGSYYLRYPQRQRDFAALIEAVQSLKPVEIYDRNHEKPHPHYLFPAAYHPMILGSLPFAEIDKAYKGYRYGINMNTIKQSQSMFARRVFELMASNTVVVSNFSRGVRLLFGDLVIASDEASQITQRLTPLCTDETYYRKFRLLGLRHVMREHTYAHRLAYITAMLTGTPYTEALPSVGLVAAVHTPEEEAQVLAHVARQRYASRSLLLLRYGAACGAPHASLPHITTCEEPAVFGDAIATLVRTHSLVGHLDPRDYYGPAYVMDLALASRYAPAMQAFGKVAHYHADGSLQQDGTQYRPTTHLTAAAALWRSTHADWRMMLGALQAPHTPLSGMEAMLATDEFHYCRGGATATTEAAPWAGDLPITAQGVSFANDLAMLGAQLAPAPAAVADPHALPQLSAQAIFQALPATRPEGVSATYRNGAIHITSTLPAGTHRYLYLTKKMSRAELHMVLNSCYQWEYEGSCEVRAVFEFYNRKNERIAHAIQVAGPAQTLAIPPECVKMRLGLRVLGSGSGTVGRLILGSHGERPAAITGHADVLVLAKQYPSYDDLYKYGFLHSRVRTYREHGLEVDMFRLLNDAGETFREFEGVDVASGDAALLDATLRTGRYRHVLVHLMDETMWRVLRPHLDHVRVTIWVHGAEIQPAHRRAFEFERLDAAEIARQEKLSEARVAFWQEVMRTAHPNLHYVFVSHYFEQEVAEDIGVPLPASQVTIVHNFIDGELFSYQPKPVSQRLKLLSIRPYASRKYANDLTVAAILELSTRPFFHELDIRLVGDGELFAELTAPLAHLPNVTCEQRFLTHQEIAALHKEYGVFLTPTRMDAQGVSRDEAMASGLVPITTDVAAIPEFVDASCGFVTPPEDPQAIAHAVEILYHTPELFAQLSEAAAARVRAQSGFAQTIATEMQLIRKDHA